MGLGRGLADREVEEEEGDEDDDDGGDEDDDGEEEGNGNYGNQCLSDGDLVMPRVHSHAHTTGSNNTNATAHANANANVNDSGDASTSKPQRSTRRGRVKGSSSSSSSSSYEDLLEPTTRLPWPLLVTIALQSLTNQPNKQSQSKQTLSMQLDGGGGDVDDGSDGDRDDDGSDIEQAFTTQDIALRLITLFPQMAANQHPSTTTSSSSSSSASSSSTMLIPNGLAKCLAAAPKQHRLTPATHNYRQASPSPSHGAGSSSIAHFVEGVAVRIVGT